MSATRIYWLLLDYVVAQQNNVRHVFHIAHDCAFLYDGYGRVLSIFDSESHRTISDQMSDLIKRVPNGNFDILIVGSVFSKGEATKAVPELFNGSAYFFDDNMRYDLIGGERNKSLSTMFDTFFRETNFNADTNDIKHRLAQHLNDNRKTAADVARFNRKLFAQGFQTTLVLAFLIVGIFLLEEFYGGSSFVPTLMRMGANIGSETLMHEQWRLVTSMFLHGGLLHVFANTYVLVALGSFVNRMFGGPKFLMLFMISGIAGSIASAIAGKALLSVGASGALWGLFGVSAALSIMPSNYLPETIRLRFRKATVINIAINLPVSFLPMVDLWAHLGGGFAGFLVGITFIKFKDNVGFEKFVQFLHPFWWSIIVMCLGFAWIQEKPWELTRNVHMNQRAIAGLMVSVPSYLKEVQSTDHPEIHNTSFGELPRDPIKVVFSVIPLEKPMYGDQREQSFKTIKQELLGKSHEGYQRVGKPVETMTNHYTMLTEQFKNSQDFLMYRITQLRAFHVIKIEAIMLQGYSKSLDTIVQSIVNSIQEKR